MVKVGIIGHGVVGDALCEALSKKEVPCRAYDPVKLPDNKWEPILDTDMVFICVGTPTLENGKQDLRVLTQVLVRLCDYKGIVVVKSTVLPTQLAALARLNAHLRIVANPEFLTARKARADMQFATFHVVGSDDEAAANEVASFYMNNWSSATVHITSLKAAMMVKYAINSMLAIKVAHMNDLYRAWEMLSDSEVDPDWDGIVDMLRSDNRMGHSHMRVPGPDGNFGFGGACFPKDTEALLEMSNEVFAHMHTLEGALCSNKVATHQCEEECMTG